MEPRKARTPPALAQHHRQLNQRLRMAFLAGAEERSRERFGRGLSNEELLRIIDRYPGDVSGS